MSEESYRQALGQLDGAICEALAVSQAQAQTPAAAHIGYATHIFAGMCGHGVALIRAAPLSRWVRADFDHWAFCAAAPHARAIVEGLLSFTYWMDAPASRDEESARVNVMHLYDCTTRVKLMNDIGSTASAERLRQTREELLARLEANPYFAGLREDVRKSCLAGGKPWIKSREQLLGMAGLEASDFGAFWTLYSQHSHILPLSYYLNEPNGRGSGLLNDTDRDYLGSSFRASAGCLKTATDRLVTEFPDTANVRQGTGSQFRPGPNENTPPGGELDPPPDESRFAHSGIARAIGAILRGRRGT